MKNKFTFKQLVSTPLIFLLIVITVLALVIYKFGMVDIKFRPNGELTIHGENKPISETVDVPKNQQINSAVSSVVTTGPIINIHTGDQSPTINGDHTQLHYEISK